jgi:hypothetical protein
MVKRRVISERNIEMFLLFDKRKVWGFFWVNDPVGAGYSERQR